MKRTIKGISCLFVLLMLSCNVLLAQSNDDDEVLGAVYPGARYYKMLTQANYQSDPLFLETLDLAQIDYPRLHAAMNFETNRMRLANGRNELPWSLGLEIMAYHHSKLMAQRNFFSHTSIVSGRQSTEQRAKLAGITNPKIAENIASSFALQYSAGKSYYTHGPAQISYTGKSSDLVPIHTYLSFAKAVVNQWMNSPGHRANILSANAKAMGNGAFLQWDGRSAVPKFLATQNYQWFYPTEEGTSQDPPPPIM